MEKIYKQCNVYVNILTSPFIQNYLSVRLETGNFLGLILISVLQAELRKAQHYAAEMKREAQIKRDSANRKQKYV